MLNATPNAPMQSAPSTAYTDLLATSSTTEPLAQIMQFISVSGGLEAPDPNRPFQSRPTPPQATPHATRTQNGPSQQPGSVCQPLTVAVQQGSKAATAGPRASGAQTGAGSRAAATGGSAGSGLAQRRAQATPQDRVLAKLGLSKGGHASKAGEQSSKAAAPPSGGSPPPAHGPAYYHSNNNGPVYNNSYNNGPVYKNSDNNGPVYK